MIFLVWFGFVSALPCFVSVVSRFVSPCFVSFRFGSCFTFTLLESTKIKHTKIKHPHFDRKPPKYPDTKISQFTVFDYFHASEIWPAKRGALY